MRSFPMIGLLLLLTLVAIAVSFPSEEAVRVTRHEDAGTCTLDMRVPDDYGSLVSFAGAKQGDPFHEKIMLVLWYHTKAGRIKTFDYDYESGMFNQDGCSGARFSANVRENGRVVASTTLN